MRFNFQNLSFNALVTIIPTNTESHYRGVHDQRRCRYRYVDIDMSENISPVQLNHVVVLSTRDTVPHDGGHSRRVRRMRIRKGKLS